jgi:hypothetical protein
MIAGSFAAAHVPVHPGIDEPVMDIGAQQQVIEAKSCITLPSRTLVVPEGVDALAGMEMADRVRPTPAESLLKAARLSGCIRASSFHEVVG